MLGIELVEKMKNAGTRSESDFVGFRGQLSHRIRRLLDGSGSSQLTLHTDTYTHASVFGTLSAASSAGPRINNPEFMADVLE